MSNLSDNARGVALMIVAMAAFTFNDACMKALGGQLPLAQSILMRGVLTSLGLLLLSPRLGGLTLRLPARDRPLVALRVFAEVASTLTFLLALWHMPFANLSAIMQALPLAVTLAAALIFKEKIGWRRLTAILVGFAGVMLIVRPGGASFDVYALLGLASMALVVLRDLVTRRLSPEVTSVTIAFFAAASVTLTGAVWAVYQGFAPVTPRAALFVLGASAFLIVGYMTIVQAMRVGELSFVAPFRYSSLLWAILLGVIGFGEIPRPLTLLGAAIVVASGIYMFQRERRLARRP